MKILLYNQNFFQYRQLTTFLRLHPTKCIGKLDTSLYFLQHNSLSFGMSEQERFHEHFFIKFSKTKERCLQIVIMLRLVEELRSCPCSSLVFV